MNRTLKNILIGIFVPTAIAAVYFGYQFYSRKQKEAKILEELKKFLHKKKMVNGLDEQIIKGWKSELSKLKQDDLNNFFNYFMVVIPDNFDDTVKELHKDSIEELRVKAFESISGKQIEKMFKSIRSEK